MKEFILFIVIFTVATGLSSCVSTKKEQMDFQNKMDVVYYQKVLEGENHLSSRIDFHILFKEPIPSEIILQKIHFRNQESEVMVVNKQEYSARFIQQDSQQDLILDSDSTKEYGNRAPIIKDRNGISNPNDAVLEYKMKDKIHFFKISNVQERQ